MPTCARSTGDIHYEVLGSGPPVVLGHSFLCSGEMWGPQLEPLARRNRVLNLDLRGHGRSSPASGPFALYDLVDDVLAVLDREQVDRCVWAGLSIGGMVALRAALVAKQRVSGLILLDTHAGGETAINRLKSVVMGGAVRVLGPRRLAPTMTRMFFGPDSVANQPALVAEWQERFASVHVDSMFRTMEALKERASVVGRLKEIDVPSLVIVGEQDALLPAPCSQEIAAGITDASLVVVEKAGHLCTLEQPDPVTSAMVSFLERLPLHG